MKRNILLLFLLPALLLAGCQNPMDDHGPEAGSPTTFTATIDGDEPATRTLLGAATTAGRDVLWSSNDQIAIGAATYTVRTGAGTATATFTGSGASQTGGKYEAYYPTSIYNGGSRALPAVQNYELPTSADGNRVVAAHLPMYAESPSTNLNFKNLCAVLNFQLKGTDTEKVTRVVVTSATMKLNGSFDPVADGTGYKASMTGTPTTAEKKVELDCTGGVSGGNVPLNATTPTEFCIALPPATYGQNDLTVEVYGYKGSNTTTEVLLMPAFKNSAVAGSQLERSKIYDIGKTATNERYVFNVTDPTDLTYESGTSTNGKVVSYKYTGTNIPANRTAVAWDVEGYYATAADAAAGTNRLSSISATYLNSFTPVSKTGGDAGESVTINYAADGSPTTSDPVPVGAEITAKLKSNAAKGSSSSYWNLANPSTGARTAIAETANTYIVNAPGFYCFPLVMGNGIKNNSKNTVAYRQTNFVNYQGGDLNTSTSSPLLNDQGGTPTSAYIVWADADMVSGTNSGNSWTLPSGCITNSTLGIDGESKTVYWLNFQITADAIKQGCIVLAVVDASDTVMWSWMIWVTDYVSGEGDVECTYDAAGRKVTFMPVNLGWVTNSDAESPGTKYKEASAYVRLRQTGTDNYAVMAVTRPEKSIPANKYAAGHVPFYQFGRKDPLVPSRGYAMSGSSNMIDPLYSNTLTSSSVYPYGSASYMNEAIQNPERFYRAVGFTGAYDPGDWCLTRNYGWWCAGNTEYGVDKPTSKTIYDPCPAGYTVPRLNAFKGFRIGDSNTGYTGNLESYTSINVDKIWYNTYWSGYRANETVPTDGMETIVFPMTGFRSAGSSPSGNALLTESRSFLWMAVPFGASHGGTGMYLGGNIHTDQSGSINTDTYRRASAFAIRPAREE